jgi:D-sedoheptulose 7-phosphate isomerase
MRRTGANHPAGAARRAVTDSIEAYRRMLDSGCVEQAAEVAGRIVTALRAGHKVIFFGNGGSAMDAGHLAAELLGRFYYDRPPLPAVALPDATAAVTAIGNDYGYEAAFARQLAGLGAPGDIAVGLTTSGNSANVLRALEVAQDMGIGTVALTGESGGKVADLADICIRVPTDDVPRVQELCMHLGHSICELVEQAMFPPLRLTAHASAEPAGGGAPWPGRRSGGARPAPRAVAAGTSRARGAEAGAGTGARRAAAGAVLA